MTDILERLQGEVVEFAMVDRDGKIITAPTNRFSMSQFECAAVMIEAADEIKKLRALIKCLTMENAILKQAEGRIVLKTGPLPIILLMLAALFVGMMLASM